MSNTQATGTGRPEVGELTPETVEVVDLPRFPGMTGWFGPKLLGQLLLRVIIADVFGQYADRRLINAALDTVDPQEHRDRADFTADMVLDDEGAVWFDYAADLGDGFDPTYAVACLLAQKELALNGAPNGTAPRGSLLVLGGDEVYPTAEREDYKIKMRFPYSFALPNQSGAKHLPMLLLPGNHDWYDGLVNFLAIFCREKATAIGNWRTDQRRSYFAAKLTESWWIWGIDIALVHDMDQPQADYFVAIAEGMPQGANIILCSAEPGWYKAESNGESFRTLSYAAWIAENAKDEHGQTKDLKIPLVLSGDSHHYAHYFGGGTHYITSGGGGAFLHGTLELKPKIEAEWLRDRCAVLNLVSCYPTKDESKKLLDGNHHFGKLNAGFTLLLAGLYWVFAFALTSRLHWDTMLIEFCILVGGLLAYSRYQEGLLSRTIVTVAALQGLAHVLVIAGISGLALLLNWLLLYWIGWNWLLWLGYLAIFAFTLGRWLSGKIFGLTLMYTCRYHDMNHNDAFSSMQLDSHRNFLRIRILRDTLTVFPVKLDKVPARNEWRKNPARQTNPTAAVFDTEVAMNPELVEKPIVIQAQHAPTTAEVRTPGELPRR